MKPRTEESLPRRRVESVTWDSEPEARRRLLKSNFCNPCGKLSLPTQADAHSYIGLLLSKRFRAPRPGESTLRPYKCPRGNGWHVGRDRRTAKLLEEKR